MTEVSRCPHCSEPLPVDGPAGVCPACVLRLGLETNAAGGARGKAPSPPSSPHLSHNSRSSSSSGRAEWGPSTRSGSDRSTASRR